jgi:hypothetical protein
MCSRQAASRAASQEDTTDDSSSGEEQYVIQPQPRRTTRKTRATTSQAAAKATNMVEGQAVSQAREARASDIIYKVEHPLRANFEYTLRRVDHRHPRMPMDFTRGENQSMINTHEDPHEWTSDLHDHRFWNNFQADWYLSYSVLRKQK